MAVYSQGNISIGKILLNSSHLADDSKHHGGPNQVWYELTSDSAGSVINNTNRLAMTFGVGVGFTTTGFSLKIALGLDGGHNVTFELQDVDGDGLPDGTVRASRTVEVSTLPSSQNDWTDFTWSSTYALSNNTKYALVIYTSNDSSNVNIARQISHPVYTMGARCTSTDTGATWTEDTTMEILFKISPDYISGTYCFVTDVNETGESYVAELPIINRTGGKLQILGSASREWVISAFVKGTGEGVETFKTLLNTYKTSKLSYPLHIEAGGLVDKGVPTHSTNVSYISGVNAIVKEVSWDGMEAGAIESIWYYTITLKEDTS